MGNEKPADLARFSRMLAGSANGNRIAVRTIDPRGVATCRIGRCSPLPNVNLLSLGAGRRIVTYG
jgi:hypothetical protein